MTTEVNLLDWGYYHCRETVEINRPKSAGVYSVSAALYGHEMQSKASVIERND